MVTATQTLGRTRYPLRLASGAGLFRTFAMSRCVIVAVLVGGVAGVWGCDLCAVYNAGAARGESAAGFHVAVAEQFTHSGTLQHEGAEVVDPAGQYRDSAITA